MTQSLQNFYGIADGHRPYTPVVLLVSPAPVDGYPPVQYQARLLAEAGYEVVLLTSTLPSSDVPFSTPGVTVERISMQLPSRRNRYCAKLRFLLALLRLRRRYRGRLAVEISYDVDGLFYSQMCPRKPHNRIVHLHEILFSPTERFYEQYAVKFLPQVASVVVADSNRAAMLREQVNLERAPLVVPNYPLIANTETPGGTSRGNFSDDFRVVYHGSLGLTQALDTVVRSVKYWPKGATLHLYGRNDTQTAKQLQGLAAELGVSGVVRFEGWRSLEQIEELLPSYHLGLSLLRPLNYNLIYSLGASNKRYQYMLAGIPQISDPGADVRELLEGEKVGLCADPENPRAIAEKVRFYFENPHERLKAGMRAHELCRTRFHYRNAFAPVLAEIKQLSFFPA